MMNEASVDWRAQFQSLRKAYQDMSESHANVLFRARFAEDRVKTVEDAIAIERSIVERMENDINAVREQRDQYCKDAAQLAKWVSGDDVPDNIRDLVDRWDIYIDDEWDNDVEEVVLEEW